MSTVPTEFKPGIEIHFFDKGKNAPIERGIVNGDPMVSLQEDVVNTYIPVHVPQSNKNIMVHTTNITGIIRPRR